MNQLEKRRLETQIIRSGFKGFSDPDLIPVLAHCIKNHKMLAALLNSCSILERQTMLECLKPHLPFEAFATVDKYEAMMAEQFAAEERELRRFKIGDQKFQETLRHLATHAVASLMCYKCQRKRDYAGETIVSAVILARQDGWVRERGTNKEVCPKCECADRGQRKKCPGCSRRHYPPDCRVVGTIEPGAPAIVGKAEAPLIDVTTKQRVN
jgi:rubrerythrin